MKNRWQGTTIDEVCDITSSKRIYRAQAGNDYAAFGHDYGAFPMRARALTAARPESEPSRKPAWRVP